MPLLALARFALVWLGRAGFTLYAINETRKFFADNEAYLSQSVDAYEKAGATEEEQKKLMAAFTYDKVESEGKDPQVFWDGLTDAEKEALQFSPKSLQADIGRTKFLGLASAFLFVASLVAAGVGIVRGMPVLLTTLKSLRDSRAAGATATELLTIIEEGKIAAISKVWAPGIATTFLGATGWLTSSMTNNLNDATLWGRIFLGQAADDFEKAQKQMAEKASGGGASGSATSAPKTIIRIVEDKRPEQFIGTLFSAKLGSAESFNRQIDDEITDINDLREDVKVNLNRWLASLPNRMGYSVVVRKDPVDEYGTKQSGIWATLTIFITHISGKITPIDTILLGPVNPKTRLELQKQTKSIENEIKGFINAASVQEIQVPNGTVDIFGPDGERTTLSDVTANVPTASEVKAGSFEGPGSSSSTPGASSAPATPRKIVTSSQAKATDEKQRQFEENVANIPKELREGPAAVGFEGNKLGPVVEGAALRIWQTVLTDTPGTVLNVRSSAGLSAPIKTKLDNGTPVGVAGGVQQADGLVWLPIVYKTPSGLESGIVAIDFIKAT